MKVDLPEPDGPVSATNSPGHDVQRHAAQRVQGHVAEPCRSWSDPARKSAASSWCSAAAPPARPPGRPVHARGSSGDVVAGAAAAAVAADAGDHRHPLGERTAENRGAGAVRDAGSDRHGHQPACRRAPTRRHRGPDRRRPQAPVRLHPGRPGVALAPAVATGARTSADGRTRSAAFGTRSTSVARAISTVTFAVMPGFKLRSELGTSMTVT